MPHLHESTPTMAYNSKVDELQKTEYPMLQGKTYMDHGGTTIYAKSLIDRFAANLGTNLYGNPHSASTPAMLSGKIVDDTRERTLRFFGANPEDFDLVFVANATAAIKLIMECFKDLGSMNVQGGKGGGFWYGYHVDAHNSIVGVRECTDNDYHLFREDVEVDQWLSGSTKLNESGKLGLFAYPGQSNMNGRRLPLNWPGLLRKSQLPSHRDTYSLLDAAALATTYPLHGIFANSDAAPDFTALSFYKIFGFPDLGGLIIRKASGNILKFRKYFGGGTVALVTVLDSKPWYETKELIHESLEDGTLPFHNIIALNAAIATHEQLYGPDPMVTISRHTNYLGKRLYDAMAALRHPNGVPLCNIYKSDDSRYGDSTTQGATIAFNLQRPDGSYVPYMSAVEAMADKKDIYLRSGQLCNPGGVASHLGYEKWHIQRLWSYGYRCGEHEDAGTEVYHGRPTGVVRVSLGAMTTMANVDTLINFLKDQFVGQNAPTKHLKRQSFGLPSIPLVTDKSPATQSVPQIVKERQETIAERVESFMRPSGEDESSRGQSHLLPLMFRENDESFSQRVNFKPLSPIMTTAKPSSGRSNHIANQLLQEKEDSRYLMTVPRSDSPTLDHPNDTEHDHEQDPDPDNDDDSLADVSQVDLSYCQAYEFVPRSPRPYIRSNNPGPRIDTAYDSEHYASSATSESTKVPIIHPHLVQGGVRTVERPTRKGSKSLKRFFVPKEVTGGQVPMRRASSRLSVR